MAAVTSLKLIMLPRGFNSKEREMLPLSLPSDFVPEETVLFVGSGFSYGAIAINEKPLPLGKELDNRLAVELKLSIDKYSGKTLAQIAAKKHSDMLMSFLYDNLSVKTYESYHSSILKENWYRIYSTNFDDLIEIVRRDQGNPAKIYSFRDQVPNRIEINSVIHLHGYIGSVTHGNASDELTYALNAYASIHSNRPEWLNELNRSLKFAKNVIFIGYSSEYDEHIRDIMAIIPGLKQKTLFVLGGTEDPVQEMILEDYGQVLWCGTSGFSDLLKNKPKNVSPALEKNRLRSFIYFNPSKDRKAYAPVTFSEISNLLAFGNYNRARFYRDLDSEKYLVFRDSALDKSMSIIAHGQSLLVHSHLGNGKTIFIETLSARLTDLGYNCFIYKTETSSQIEETKFLNSFDKPIVIFDDYTIAREVVPAIRRDHPKLKFVITIRTGTFDYRAPEVGRVFGASIGVVDLNRLTQDEFLKFEKWASSAGIVAKQHREGYGRLLHIREFILDKFENSIVIHDKVLALVSALQADRKAFRAFVVLMVFRHIGEEPESELINFHIIESDPRVVLQPYSEVWGEIANADAMLESSIFSEFVISRFIDADDLLRVVEGIVSSVSSLRKKSKRYDAIFAKCLNFGTLFRLCGSSDQAKASIIRSYDRLRHNPDIDSQPLFWLQVAIAMTSKGDLRAAWQYIGAAYSRVMEDFEPYHIDTKALEVLFRLGSQTEEAFGDAEYQGLESAFTRCIAMISNDRNRPDVFSALNYSEDFFKVRALSLESVKKVRLAYYLRSAIAQLQSLSPSIRAHQGTAEVVRKLERSVALIKY